MRAVVSTHVPYMVTYDLEAIDAERPSLTPEQEERREAIEAEIGEIEAASEDPDYEPEGDDEARVEALQAELAQIDGRPPILSDAQKAGALAYLVLGPDGTPHLHEEMYVAPVERDEDANGGIDEPEGGNLKERLPPIQRWLNRILALRIAVQNAIFDEYLGLIEARVDAARAAGTLDVGVETILAERIDLLDDRLLRADPETGAETRLQRLELHIRRHATDFAELMRLWRGTGDIAFLHNRRSRRVALRVPSWSVTDEEGRPVAMCRLIRPAGSERVTLHSLDMGHWHRIGEVDFGKRWQVEAAEARERLDTETITIATGLLLPVWNRLPEDDVRVWRIADASGHSMLGRIVPPRAVARLAQDFGVEMAGTLTVEEVIAAATSTDGAALPALGEAMLHRVLVNGTHRLEIRNYPPERREWLKSLGCFTEIIQYKTRLFVPVDRATEILATVIAGPER